MHFINAYLLTPWIHGSWIDSLWICIMGFLVCASCGLIGNFIILRRMALLGDALSHTILPGIVIAFLIAHSKSTFAMFTGAIVAGIVTNLLIEFISHHSSLKTDTVIGVIFSSLFSIGIVLTAIYADTIDLDQECILYGELAFISYQDPVTIGLWTIPLPVLRMGLVFIVTAFLLYIFYKELVLTCFDKHLASSLGIPTKWFHYGMTICVSVVIVSGFEAVGAILVVGMLILPGATASLISHSLPNILKISVVLSMIYSFLGLHLAFILNCSIGGAMVVVAFLLLLVVWSYVCIRKHLASQYSS